MQQFRAVFLSAVVILAAVAHVSGAEGGVVVAGESTTVQGLLRTYCIWCHGEKSSKGQVRQSRLTFHALRHFFTSALANAGAPEKVRMKLTGHTTSLSA